ncbi:hypothetical protein GO730_08195 [Spirosoma sp. HMF3257]|uniref:Uncharacterized protein n=1 Tax=Spirosoma telluris TaxID=2183553 RepID=A0A327NNR8_9BACT|nr:hypothetical protein [Spirosoma telluris]RAI74288.1 hypothetical protein HMF3257_08105 [Spirosoma telluris]
MELDDFKALYQSRFEQVPDKSRADLEEMLRKRSYTAIERILQNLLWEVGASLVIMLVLAIVMATWSSNVFRWLGVGLVILSIIQVVAFTWQYRQLKTRLNEASGSVRHYLQDIVEVIDRFVRIYYRYCMISVPVAMILGGVVGFYVGVTNDRRDPAFSALPENPTVLFTVASIIVAIAFVIGTYFMLKWYIHRLYGQYLEDLKLCLRELNEPPR